MKTRSSKEKDVLVCTMDLRPLAEADVFQKFYSRMSAARREKIDRVKKAEAKRQSLGVGILLDYGLREHGLREKDIRIRQGENGKPCLADNPGVFFNLSHSKEMAMAVFAQNDVGCDIEHMEDGKEKVAGRFFCPEEGMWIENARNPEEKKERFFRLWTLKESFQKATGAGMRLSMTSFCFEIGEQIRVRQSYDEMPCRFWEKGFSEYRAAVCVRTGEAVKITEIEVDPELFLV